MKVINESKVNYRDEGARISEDTLKEIEAFVSEFRPIWMSYCATVVPNSYKWAKGCQWARYDRASDTLTIYDGRALMGKRNQLTVWVGDWDQVEVMRGEGFKLFQREQLAMSRAGHPSQLAVTRARL